MAIYSDPPEWNAKGQAPPQEKRNAGWHPKDRVPASWLNWFWNRVSKSLQEIQQAFINHRDASAPHDGHETKVGANQKIQTHSDKTTGVHGVGAGFHVATTSRADQRVGWNDVVEKPDVFPPANHDHDDRYYTKGESNSRYAPYSHAHGPEDLPKASTSAQGIVILTSSRTSRSEEMALTARAMDDHRGSSDHDGRYYTKAQVEALLAEVSPTWMVPGDTLLASISSSRLIQIQYRNIAFAGFYVKNPGRYRVRFKMATLYSSSVYVWLGLPGGINLSSRVSVSSTTTVYTLDCTNGHVPGGGMVCLYFYPYSSSPDWPTIAMDWARLYGVPGSPPPEYQGVYVPNWAW